MSKKVKYSENFFKSLNALTGISIRKIKTYAKENNPFNILEHPMVVDPNERQLEKISRLNEFISSYNVLRMEEEENRIILSSSQNSGKYFLSLLSGMRDKERFMVAFLDNSNRIIETRIVTEGTVDMAIVHPRDILKIAIANDCNGIIISHNHPSGKIEFSNEDKAVTQRIVDIFHPLNIRVLDHILVGGNQYASLAQNAELPKIPLNKARYDSINFGEEAKRDENNEIDNELEL